MNHQQHKHCKCQNLRLSKFYKLYCKLYNLLLLIQQDYSIMEVDDNKIIEYDIQPIHLSQPANIKNGDQVYVIQHPRGGSLAFSSSDSTVKSECVCLGV